MSKWLNISYLDGGNTKQQLCFAVITELNLIRILKDFEPIAVGTIPIEIDIDSSDLDIICNSDNLAAFQKLIRSNFSHLEGFGDSLYEIHYVAHFFYKGLEVEIFAQNQSSVLQNAYRHMFIEDRILKLAGDNFRKEIIKLKTNGIKTEPAFGILLDLKEPYSELLLLEELSDTELIKYIKSKTLSI